VRPPSRSFSAPMLLSLLYS